MEAPSGSQVMNGQLTKSSMHVNSKHPSSNSQHFEYELSKYSAVPQ